MKFDQLYPNAAAGFKSKDYEGIILSESKGRCIICNSGTCWLDEDFDVLVCSEECAIQLLEEYLKECSGEK